MGSQENDLRDVEQKFSSMLKARYPLTYLVSWEEQRVDRFFGQLAKKMGYSPLCWSVTKGEYQPGEDSLPLAGEINPNPLDVLFKLEHQPEKTLLVLKDYHHFLQDHSVVRKLRELCPVLTRQSKHICILAPSLKVPLELEKDISVLDFPLPSFDELYDLLKRLAKSGVSKKKIEVKLSKEEAQDIVRAAQGLTLTEAENVFARAMLDDGKLDITDIDLVTQEKKQIIRKTGLLEYFPADSGLNDIGGLNQLKSWVQKRKRAFSLEATEFGLPEPKGLLLLGVQGCGKSLSARAIANFWKLPLLRLDMGKIFSGYIGSSEANMRKAILTAESIAPTVLWMDEIEKGLSGMGGSGSSDAGTSSRVFGSFLSWMQDKKKPVFVVATANRIDILPPELLRKGRFDEIFFVDLPEAQEREDICRIHLKKRGRNPDQFNPAQLAAEAKGFSGAEIEQSIVDALYEAFAAGRQLSQSDLEKAFQETIPLSVTMREEIDKLREWASQRARKAG